MASLPPTETRGILTTSFQAEDLDLLPVCTQTVSQTGMEAAIKAPATATHPSSRAGFRWFEEEKERLRDLVCIHGPGRWEEKARLMGTGRTGKSLALMWDKIKRQATGVDDIDAQPTYVDDVKRQRVDCDNRQRSDDDDDDIDTRLAHVDDINKQLPYGGMGCDIVSDDMDLDDMDGWSTRIPLFG